MTIKTFRFEDEETVQTRFDLKFFRVQLVVSKNSHLSKLHCTFLSENLEVLSLLKEVKPFPDRKKIKLLTFDNLLPSL